MNPNQAPNKRTLGNKAKAFLAGAALLGVGGVGSYEVFASHHDHSVERQFESPDALKQLTNNVADPIDKIPAGKIMLKPDETPNELANEISDGSNVAHVQRMIVDQLGDQAGVAAVPLEYVNSAEAQVVQRGDNQLPTIVPNP